MTTTTTHPTASASVAQASPTARVLQRSRRDDTASIPTALHSEWIKVSSLRSNVTILALTPVIGLALSWILATFVKIDPDTDLPFTVGLTFIFSTWLTTVLAAIIGTLMFTSEAQHGTMAIAVAAQPARWVIVASKTIVAASFGLAIGILGMIGVSVERSSADSRRATRRGWHRQRCGGSCSPRSLPYSASVSA